MKRNVFVLNALLCALLLGMFGCSKSETGPLAYPEDETDPKPVNRILDVQMDLDCSSKLATIHVLELNSALKETGRDFLIKKGDSSVFRDSLSLNNRYALLRTEEIFLPTPVVNGRSSSVKIAANFEVLVDLENPKSPYVSLAGHFVTARAKKLVSQGVPADSAILQAERELYDVFAFDTDSLASTSVLQYEDEADATYAARVIFQIFRQFIVIGNFNEQFGQFVSEFAEKGSIEGFEAFAASADALVDRMFIEAEQHAVHYHNNVRIVSSTIFARQFYAKLFGLGNCSMKNLCEIKKLEFEKSEYNDSSFICDTLGWVFSTRLSRNVCSFGVGADYEIRTGALDSTISFYYLPVLNKWKEMDYVQENIGICKDDRNGEYAFIKDYAYFKCGNYLWQQVSRDEYNLSDVKCDTLPKYYILGRDSVTYYACEKGVVSSISPEENLYVANTQGIPCDTTPDLVLGNDSATYYVCYGGKFFEASELEKAAKRGCVASNYDEEILIENSYYRCRGTWKYNKDHIYRDTVTDKRDGKSYPLVGMGSQVWFAANLNYETDSSWCFRDSTKYCEEYGRIYRFAEAASKNKDSLLCPSGFHVPTEEEYETLLEFATKWIPASQHISVTQALRVGTDYFGFGAQIAGKRHLDGEYTLYDVDYCTSSEVGTDGHVRWMYDSSQYFKIGTTKGENYCYMRCIAD